MIIILTANNQTHNFWMHIGLVNKNCCNKAKKKQFQGNIIGHDFNGDSMNWCFDGHVGSFYWDGSPYNINDFNRAASYIYRNNNNTVYLFIINRTYHLYIILLERCRCVDVCFVHHKVHLIMKLYLLDLMVDLFD